MTDEPETFSLADLPPDSIREDWTERDLEEHLDGLPQRVLVGIALRCADRIRSLDPYFRQLHRKRLYDICRSDDPPSSDTPELFFWQQAGDAGWRSWPNVSDTLAVAEGLSFIPTIDSLHGESDRFHQHTIRAAIATVEAAEYADKAMNSRDLPSARLMRRAIWIDLVRFTAFGQAVRSDDPLGPAFDPLDESKFGPLWPEGRPTGWPADLLSETPAFADRQPDATLRKQPPRNMRFEPEEGPIGSDSELSG